MGKRKLEDIKPRDIVLVDGDPWVILGHKKGSSKDIFYGFELGSVPQGIRCFNVRALIYADELELIGKFLSEMIEIDDPWEVKPA